MASRTDQIVAAIVALLEAAAAAPGAPADLAVDRFPTRVGKGNQIGVYPIQEPVEAAPQGSGPLSKRRLRLVLEIRADGGTGSIDQELDPLYVFAVRTILADRRLGGVVIDMQEVLKEWKASEGERPHGVLLLHFTVTHQTRADNPEVRA